MKASFNPCVKTAITKRIYTILIAIFFCNHINAQTVTWVGSASTDYFTAANWSPSTNMATLAQTEVLMIGKGTNYNCVLSGGSTGNTYKPGKLNTLTGGTFTANGVVYPWASDSLNGTINVDPGADLNDRNIGYIGRNSSAIMNLTSNGKFTTKYALYLAYGNAGSSATINVSGGTIYTGTDLYIANGTGLTAVVNITGGTVNIPGNLYIGTGGSIFISGIGVLKLTGDKRTQLNALITGGQLTCTSGKTLAVTYDGTNTIVQITQNPNSMITEYPDSVVLHTTNLVCTIDKNSGNVISYRYKGVETVANKPTDTHQYMYHDFTTSYGFETIFGGTYEVVQDSLNFAHIVIKRPYTPSIGHVTPVDCELHFALKKDDKAVYVYSKLEHKPNYPAFDIGSWRQVWWIASTNGINLCERIYTDSLRSWQMPAPGDTYTGSGGPQEIIKMTSGVRAGKYDGKYEYSLRFWDNPLWGHASNINNIGSWCVNASCEYYNEGPMYHDLNAAAGIIHQCMNGVHYGALGLVADTLTSWKKIYGPYLLLITDKSTGDSNWIAAKQRQVQEKALWPYSWVKDTLAYPMTNQRGTVTGKFVISDALKPSFKGAGAWVGVTDLSDGATNFQYECKSYQYWVKSDANGNFSIPNIRPGTYSFFAFVDSAVGEFRQDNIVVTSGVTTNLGTLTRTIDRTNGTLVWEIGTPNRMANEFKMGDFDYCEGMVQNKFRDTFPNPIEYNVADNNWSKKLCYSHTKYPDTAANSNPGDLWKWRLNFTLPANLPTTGNARLTIAYASNDHAQQWIYVNNENTLFTSYYPDNGDGNAFIRQTNYAKYTYKQVLIPMNKLVTGTNTITLGMPSNSAWVSHLMYDYISLEASVPTLSPSVAIAASATTICAGTSVTFTATPVNGGTAPVYQWKINGNNVGTNSNTFTTTNLANSNVVSCVLTSNATNVITNTATSNSITITVNTLPAKPTVAWDGVQLSVPSTYTTYQWLLNNVTVSNATTNNYKPVNSGYYQAAVTNAAGCKAVSDSFAVTITAIANPATSGTASVYPNPSNGNITVDLGFNPSTTINLVIISSTGNHIKTIQTNNRKTSIATTELATGVYYIKVSSGVYNRLLPFTVN